VSFIVWIVDCGLEIVRRRELAARVGTLYHHSLRDFVVQDSAPEARDLQSTTHNPQSPAMSIDKSLKRKGGMTKQRCVLTRAERIAKMMENGRWADGQSPFGLPKTRVQKIVLKKKAKKEAVEGGEAGAAGATPGAAGATPAAAATPAAKAPAAKK
jgi:small basic protein (TIGR04137 family)